MNEIRLKKSSLKHAVFGIILVFVLIASIGLLNQKEAETKRELTEQEAMIEHCKMMPQIAGCDKYLFLAKHLSSEMMTIFKVEN